MYLKPSSEKGNNSPLPRYVPPKWHIFTYTLDTDELVPQDGKDEVYDTIMTEIEELEEYFEKELKKFEKKLGYDKS